MINEEAVEVGGKVCIPQEIVAHSDACKAKKPRTTAQLPVFRSASNQMFLATQIMQRTARKLTRYADIMLTNADEVCRFVALANETHLVDDRVYYISQAIATNTVLRNYFGIAEKLLMVSSRQHKELRKLSENVGAQLAAWRAYTEREGIQSNVR